MEQEPAGRQRLRCRERLCGLRRGRPQAAGHASGKCLAGCGRAPRRSAPSGPEAAAALNCVWNAADPAPAAAAALPRRIAGARGRRPRHRRHLALLFIEQKHASPFRPTQRDACATPWFALACRCAWRYVFRKAAERKPPPWESVSDAELSYMLLLLFAGGGGAARVRHTTHLAGGRASERDTARARRGLLAAARCPATRRHALTAAAGTAAPARSAAAAPVAPAAPPRPPATTFLQGRVKEAGGEASLAAAAAAAAALNGCSGSGSGSGDAISA
ncbi:uncharacterized protein LOC126260509 [Schistocerca nitens]|uniref:uncharacterized protein LOC126260509 n=1 Tax=Schistocerca nitens TaxID=7011 RepID=UPI00211744C7|nr:uncharacterized protein LOC126260509 [Schistocerca nitens]